MNGKILSESSYRLKVFTDKIQRIKSMIVTPTKRDKSYQYVQEYKISKVFTGKL